MLNFGKLMAFAMGFLIASASYSLATNLNPHKKHRSESENSCSPTKRQKNGDGISRKDRPELITDLLVEIFPYLSIEDAIAFSSLNKSIHGLEQTYFAVLNPMSAVIRNLSLKNSSMNKIKQRVLTTGIIAPHIDLSRLRFNDQQVQSILDILDNSLLRDKIKSIDLSHNAVVLEDYLADSLGSLPWSISFDFSFNKASNLFNAIKRQNVGIVKAIISTMPTAMLTISDKDGNSPLHAIAMMDWTERERERESKITMAQDLVNVSPQLLEMQNATDLTALHVAIARENFDLALLLIDEINKVDANWFSVTDNLGATALHYSIIKNSMEVFDALIEAKPELLMITRHENYPDVVTGITALHVAVEMGYFEITEKILNSIYGSELLLLQASNTGTALHHAAFVGAHGMIRLLLDKARSLDLALLDVRNSRGKTALHIAAENNKIEALKILIKSSPNPAELLATQDNFGRTAIHSAVKNNNLEALKILIKSSSDLAKLLAAQDDYGRTAIHLAAKKNKTDILEMLIEEITKNGQLEILAIRDHEGMTAHHVAADEGNIRSRNMLQKIYAKTSDMEDIKGMKPSDYIKAKRVLF